MKELAVIVLALMQLTLVDTNNRFGHWLTAQADDSHQPSSHHLLTTLPHQNLSQPVKTGNATLQLGASGVLVVDVSTMQTLYTKNADIPRPIASITKLATALVILHDHSLDETVTVPYGLPTYQPADVVLGISPGEKFKLRDLLAAALIPSDNDVADALAIYDSGTIAKFSAKMNARLSDWGITEVHFSNASGLTDQDNYASPRALAKIAKIILANPQVDQLVSTDHSSISDLAGKTFDLTSTHSSLADPRIVGIKTGYTPAAGECFVGLANLGNHQVITVVLNSPDRFAETENLLNWITTNYQWQ